MAKQSKGNPARKRIYEDPCPFSVEGEDEIHGLPEKTPNEDDKPQKNDDSGGSEGK